MSRPDPAGYRYAAASMVTWGLLPVFAHRYASAMDPILFAGLGTLIGAVPLLGLLARDGVLGDLVSWRLAPALLTIGALGAVSTILIFVGTTLTSGLNTSLLLQIEPFYSVLVASLLLGERMSARRFAATVLMVAGAAAIVYRGGAPLNTGDLMILAAPMLQQLSHVVSKSILGKVRSTTVIPTARLLWAGLAVTAVALARRPESVGALTDPRLWAALLVFGLVLRAFDCWLWYEAIRRIPLSSASALIPLAVAVSFTGSLVFLRESVQPSQLLGLALIVGGLLWFAVLPEHETL